MQFLAKAVMCRYSPYKLRPVADVIRGKNAAYALHWLATYKTKRAVPIKKVIESAVANAKHLKNIKPEHLLLKKFVLIKDLFIVILNLVQWDEL